MSSLGCCSRLTELQLFDSISASLNNFFKMSFMRHACSLFNSCLYLGNLVWKICFKELPSYLINISYFASFLKTSRYKFLLLRVSSLLMLLIIFLFSSSCFSILSTILLSPLFDILRLLMLLFFLILITTTLFLFLLFTLLIGAFLLSILLLGVLWLINLGYLSILFTLALTSISFLLFFLRILSTLLLLLLVVASNFLVFLLLIDG